MSSYRGPHVAVSQQFTPSPTAQAVEKSPSLSVGVAYDVYRGLSLGDYYGSVGSEVTAFAWTKSGKAITGVVFGKNPDLEIDRRWDFMPLVVKARLGNLEVDLKNEDYTASSNGVSITKVAAYDIASVSVDKNLYIPRLDVDTTVSKLEVLSVTGLTYVDIGSSIDVGQYGIIPGINVVVKPADAAKNIAKAGIVTSVVGNRISLDAAITFVAGDKILFGCSNSGADSSRVAVVSNVCRGSGSWLQDGVKPGDIINITVGTGAEIATPVSVTSVTDRTLSIYSGTVTAGAVKNIDQSFSADSLPNISAFSKTTAISNVRAQRLVGFSAYLGTTSEAVAASASNSFDSKGVVGVMVGDFVTAGSVRANVVSVVGTAITVDTSFASSLVKFYRPVVKSTIHAWFRSVRGEGSGACVRIESAADIKDSFGEIDECNDLAFMLAQQLGLSGGLVCYGYNVGQYESEVSAYQDALGAAENIEVSEVVFGTTNSGVTALLPGHVDKMSDPYEAKERYSIHSVDTADVFVLATSSAEMSAAGVLSKFSFQANHIGIQAKDAVTLFDANGAIIGNASVTSAPSDSISVSTKPTFIVGKSFADVKKVTIRSANKQIQAEKISSLGTGNRRSTVIFPGWFQARGASEVKLFPPYYIASAIAGLDSAFVAKQSLTNMPFALVGLSEIQLSTNFVFKKNQLDTIGGGGVDIMVQDQNSSSIIYSRHDLTTNMDAVEYRERSVTKQVDTVAKAYRSAYKKYIGRYNIGDKLITFLKQIAPELNKSIVNAGGCGSVVLNSIKRDEVVADKLNFDVTVTVEIAGNYYNITLNVLSK